MACCVVVCACACVVGAVGEYAVVPIGRVLVQRT